jgi:pyridoxamine 5'-phosphate oxidase family protein
MPLTPAEIEYLSSQPLGRLATSQPDGSPQVKPVGFRYNADLGTIDISGFGMSSSQKFRNVGRSGRVAFVVDDIVSRQPWRVRFLEIRGSAEAIAGPADGSGASDASIIRIHPARVLSFGVEEPPDEAHKTRLSTRDL